MASSATIGTLNVKVTASAAQFTAIMEDMQRQADSVGNRMKGASDKIEELGHTSARSAMRIQHLASGFAQGGLSGAMESATHIATHMGVELEGASLATQGLIIPIVAAGAAAVIFAEAWKKAHEEMAKAAEKANGMAEALKRLAEAQAAAAEGIKLGRLTSSEKLGEAAQEKEDERKALVARRNRINKEQETNNAIIEKSNPNDVFNRTGIQQADLTQALKVREGLNKDMDETNAKIAEKEKQADELRKREKAAQQKESFENAKKFADEQADLEEEHRMKRADEEVEQEKKIEERKNELRKSINSGTMAGRNRNVIEDAKKRLDELDALHNAGAISDADYASMKADLGKGALAGLESGQGRDRVLSGALEAGSSEAFAAVASAGGDQAKDPQLQAAREQLIKLGLIEENTKTPKHKIAKF